MSRAPARMVVIGPSNIGDAMLAAGVIARLHAHAPKAPLTLVIGSRAMALFEQDPRVHRLIDADAFDGWRGRVRLALALWAIHPDIVVDVRHTVLPLLLSPRSAWRYALQPPRRIAHMRDRHLWTLHAQVPSLPTSDIRHPTSEVLWFSEKDRAHVERLWKRWGLSRTQPVVIICPGARSHIKRWPAEGFAAVADRLIGDAGAQVIFSGEPAEEPIIRDIAGLMTRRAHSAVGLTTPRHVALLMQRARLVITNDSASLHLASAMDAPTVAVFGPTDASKYGPTASRHRVLRRRLFCAPCEQAQCRFNHECMRFISADEVYEAARDLLKPSHA